MSDFSLTIPIAKIIHIHHMEENKGKFTHFAKTQLIDRILGVSLSAFALIDFVWHASAVLLTGTFALGKAIVKWESIDLNKTKNHLELTALFFFTLLFGSGIGLIAPSKVREIFYNKETHFASMVLFAGHSNIFKDKSKEGGFKTREGLECFNNIAQRVPKQVKQNLVSSLKIIKDAYRLEQKSDIENLLNGLTLKKTFESYHTFLSRMDNTKGHCVKRFLFKEVITRISAVAFGLFSLLSLFQLSSNLMIGIIGTPVVLLISSKDHTHLKIESLQLTTFFKRILRDIFISTLGIVLWPTVGFISPSIAKLLLLKIDRTYSEEIAFKLKKLSVDESMCLPFSLITSVTKANKIGSHQIYLIIKKSPNEKFTVSIINRGALSDRHFPLRSLKKEADYTFEDVNEIDLKKYIDDLNVICHFDQIKKSVIEVLKLDSKHFDLVIKEPDFLNEAIKYYIQESKKSIYRKNLGRRIHSNHLKIPQRIGNCVISNLLGAISYHHAMEQRKIPNRVVDEKKEYKEFIYYFKKALFEKQKDRLFFSDNYVKGKNPLLIGRKQVAKACKKAVLAENVHLLPTSFQY